MKTFKKLFVFLGLALLLFILFLLVKTFTFKSKQLSTEPVAAIEIPASAAQNLAASLRFKTVSFEDGIAIDSIEFERFSTFLSEKYPLVDSLLEKKTFNLFSHLYKWQGSDPSLKPAVFMAHLDVVPVIDKNLPDWKADPFGGEIKKDTIWGRGAIDDKVGVIGLMEATELLLQQGVSPARTTYLAFGHDEEIGGVYGAKTIAKYLEDNGVQAEFVLDEGGSIVQGLVPGISKDVALIGTAEKGFVSLTLETKIEGGHSSMPNKETAIDVIAKAVSKLKQNPFPASMSPPMQGFMKHLGPEMVFPNKLVFANRGIFKPIIISIYEGSAAGNAVVRTTTSPTIFNSGVKDNIIPQRASATVNFRIIPGNTIESVIERVKNVIDDDRITISTSDFVAEPSAVSSTTSFGYTTLDKTIHQLFPDALTAPNMVIAATDCRHFSSVSENIYRFSPIFINDTNINSFHGLNERIAIEDFNKAVSFYVQLIKNSTAPEN